ncbi:hypothetical protein [Streptomyces naganishii]|uniref:Lipoprotein n=1 Tax=Streptomyces naganishii JCM 4654 TaxID=1306179 RepID=A0A918XYK9_9ACTN|nr:hypothetical protein GCM10010508_03390 [Streptomyces naganishii JCM 4654]
MRGGGRPGAWGRLVFVLLLAGLAGSAGCGAGGGAPTAAGPSASPSPRTTSAEELCASVVTYWSRKVLDSHTYGDYQSMGLSNGQYEILRQVVDRARSVKRRQGAAAADESIGRGARRGCADWYRAGGPRKGPWS